MAIKLLIADDDILIRESLKIILGMDDQFEVSGCVDDGFKAVRFCMENDVDVALLDIRMPVMDGVKASAEISKKTNTKCLILTTFDEDEYIESALKLGAKGYILKNNSPDKIKDAIKSVYSGNSVLQDVILQKVVQNMGKTKEEKIADRSSFSKREIEIMEAIAEGLSNKEISNKLFIGEGTVKNYISTILAKTGLEHRTQIAIYFLKGKI